MISEWLRDRLSPVKAVTQRWTELAEAIREFWDTENYPDIEFMQSLNSVFSAPPEGRELILQNLGDYFYEDNLPTDNIPMSVMWRQHELFMKQTTVPLENSLRRVGTEAMWEPLWILETDRYEDQYLFTGAEARRTSKLDGTWKVKAGTSVKIWPRRYMTSRGVLMAYLSTIQNYGDLDIARRRARMLRPAHIVIDGFRYSGVGSETVVTVDQPKLDGSWAVEEGTNIRIMAYSTSHDGILSNMEAARVVVGSNAQSISPAAVSTHPPIYTDYGDRVEIVGILHNSELVGYLIGAAGIMIDGSIYAITEFLPKIKAPDDSYSIQFTLYFQ